MANDYSTMTARLVTELSVLEASYAGLVVERPGRPLVVADVDEQPGLGRGRQAHPGRHGARFVRKALMDRTFRTNLAGWRISR